ncbi:cytochrome c3 family protein [Geothrix edaphica]|uniref:Cytochrome c n=1 Tax=Geothrix edaphica TaxID=2927976 RepID=A0ABQ5Q089_9BACT|nr:cytochrome c3 family protein [Geothrix edaphica]GLH67806.1 cytochrome c [Geothrix edaphica]
MRKSHPAYTRRKFSLRWRGRRWYDPNERKLIWSTACMAALTLVARLAVMAVSALQEPTLAAGAIPVRGLVGTAHDLSATGPYKVTHSTETCTFCHTPHQAVSGINQAIPIWNHETTTTQFLMYSNATMKGVVDPQPLGPSLACLSCHDGTLAMGALHEAPPGGGNGDYSQAQGGGVNPGTGLMQGANTIGHDLTGVHPISMTYRDDLNKSLRHPTELVGVRLYPSNVSGGKVQCGSCHDPHNYGSAGGTAPFLRVTTQGSALCLSCHLM